MERDELREYASVLTIKLDLSVMARSLEEAEIINGARTEDLKKALLYTVADAVNVLSEHTEEIKRPSHAEA
jgi:hypothetical protein